VLSLFWAFVFILPVSGSQSDPEQVLFFFSSVPFFLFQAPRHREIIFSFQVSFSYESGGYVFLELSP